MNREKFMSKLLWTGIILGFIIILLNLMFFIFPFRILTPQDGDMTIDKNIYKKGETIYLTRKYCKNFPLVTNVKTYFANGLTYEMAEITSNNPVGCQTRNLQIVIPEELPAGTYRIFKENYFHLLFGNTIAETAKSNYFKVID